jgi:antitoxin ParD1/3/4
MAQAVRGGAVQAREYASSNAITREALRDWRHKRALPLGAGAVGCCQDQ